MNSNCPSRGGFPGGGARLPQRSVLPAASTVWKAVPAAVRIALVAAASVLVAWGGISANRSATLLAAEPISAQRDQDGRYEPPPARAAVARVVLVVDPKPRLLEPARPIQSDRPIPPDREPADVVRSPSSSLALRALSGTSPEGSLPALARPANVERKAMSDHPTKWAGGLSANQLSAHQAEAPRVRSPIVPSQPAEEVKAPVAEKKRASDFDLDSRPIGAVTTNIRCQQGDLPQDVAQAKLKSLRERAFDNLTDREWEALCYFWEAPALRHCPLYFEEVNLERYGYCWPGLKPIQPVLSCGQFFVTLPLLPYKVWCEPPRECDYTLGQYRPGSPAPYQVQLPCWRPGAAAFEVGTVAGLILLIP